MPYDDAQAAQVADELKPGTWEAVEALALASIALHLTAQTPDR